MSIINFLETKTDKQKLKSALEVISEFKRNESVEEWRLCPFSAWIKLEQLEEYLEFLCNGASLKEDTIEQMKIHEIKIQD